VRVQAEQEEPEGAVLEPVVRVQAGPAEPEEPEGAVLERAVRPDP